MKKNTTLWLVISMLIVSSMVLTACGGSGALAEDPVTLNWNWGTEPPTIDPSLATDTTSVDVVGNTFMGLTRFDPVTGEVIPYLATSWESGEDADGNQTWTFTIVKMSPGLAMMPKPAKLAKLKVTRM